MKNTDLPEVMTKEQMLKNMREAKEGSRVLFLAHDARKLPYLIGTLVKITGDELEMTAINLNTGIENTLRLALSEMVNLYVLNPGTKEWETVQENIKRILEGLQTNHTR